MKKIVVGKFFWPMANLILRILKVRMEKAHQKRHVGGLRKKKQMSTHRDQIISTLETVPTVGTNVKWCAPSVDIK